jgi:hypothetical protein
MMEQQIIYRVKENEDFIKDQATGALINTNNAALEAYKAQKKSSTRVQQLEQKVDQLSSDLTEIKSLLIGLTRNG